MDSEISIKLFEVLENLEELMSSIKQNQEIVMSEESKYNIYTWSTVDSLKRIQDKLDNNYRKLDKLLRATKVE